MTNTNSGLTADTLFVGATRPPMRWGVTYSALLMNGVVTMEVFLLTKNLLMLLLAAPIHGVCALLCARDARFFDLALLWGRTRIPALLATARFWKSSTYSPLTLDLPDVRGRRRTSSELTAIAALGAGQR
jgi:type IV secretion system protein VirB3